MTDFTLPLNPDNLLIEKEGAYFVENPLSVEKLDSEEISDLIDQISQNINEDFEEGLTARENFDRLYILVLKSDCFSSPAQNSLFSLFQKTLLDLTKKIRQFFKEDTTDLEDHQQNSLQLRKNLKMTMFLYQILISKQENRILKKKPTAQSKKRTTKKTAAKENLSFWETESEKEKALVSLINLLELDLSRLWLLPQPEEQFIILFSKTCFLMIENPLNTKSTAIRRCLFTIIGILAKNYGYSFQISFTIVNNILCKFEHAAKPLVGLMEMLVNDYNNRETVSEIIREIGKLNPRGNLACTTKAHIGDMSRETAAAKNVGTFLTNLASELPEIVLSSISVLLTLLDGESYLLRNGVVQVLGQILNKAFTAENGEITTRDSLLQILADRCRDVSSYTRSKTLKSWHELAMNKTIPFTWYLTATTQAIERLEDKAQQVRKNSVKLLLALLDNNPYGPQLQYSVIKQTLQKTREVLEEKSGKKIADLFEETEQEVQERSSEVEKFLKLFSYYRDTLQFIDAIHEAIPLVIDLLASKNVTDVQESIKFLCAALKFKISKAKPGIKKILLLVWSKEDSTRDAAVNSYVELYLTPLVPLDKPQLNLYIAKNLIGLTIGATLADLTSLERFVTIATTKGHIPEGVIDVLWKIFAKKDTEKLEETRGALIILCMLGSSDASIVKDKLSLVVSALGKRSRADPLLAKYACIALQTMSVEGKDRFKSDHLVFEKLESLILSKAIKTVEWFPGAEQAVSTIYTLCENPDRVLGNIIKIMAHPFFPDSFERSPIKARGTPNKDQSRGEPTAHDLARLIFIVGSVALRQLIYIEDVHAELRKRRLEAMKKAEEESGDEDAIEKELGNAFQAEADRAEKEELAAKKRTVGTNLLGFFGPIIVSICANSTGGYTDPLLRSAAVLALTKFMCVSPEFCENQLQLLFTILEGDDEPSLKANVVIALGDLTKQFANLIKPWETFLYKRLRDPDPVVRKNTLMVLTHLINMDMIKATQLGEMAICTEDQEARIADLARLFFHELSCKDSGGNSIYNIIPDTLTYLSSATVKWRADPSDLEGVPPEVFKSIMKYLFGFIDKEQHIEALVSKLCLRFKETSDAFLWQHIAYCLSLISFGEKSIKKLAEMFKYFKEGLADPLVYETFAGILTKIKKSAKAELKLLVDELELKIVEQANA